MIEVPIASTELGQFKQINRSHINSIIKPRVEETLEMIWQRLKYYNLHKKEQGSRELDKLDLIQEYLLNGESANSQKPILWIHNSYKINARNWDSFKSRNTKDLNQPYLYLCIKSIIKHCGKSFNVVLIDDNSFRKLIPDWTVSMNIITDPIENHMRNYSKY